MEVLEQQHRGAPVRPSATEPEVGERAARRTLRDQIARLEGQLGSAVCAAYPRLPAEPVGRRGAGPRMLSLGELELLRDALADRLHGLRAASAEAADRQEAKRLLVERMLLDPAAHRWVRVSHADLGLPGCKHWHVRPRLGPVGMLAGWWHVKISSGCPLPRGSRRTPRPRPAKAERVGKRSRKQRAPGAPVRPAAAPPARLGEDRRPRAPWHPFPLVELCVLIGIVLIVVGFLSLGDRRGGVLIVCGLALGSLAGLDTVAREHFAGHRSHTTLLAGVPAVALAGLEYFARAPWIVLVLTVAAVFASAFAAFRRAFRRASGGMSFR